VGVELEAVLEAAGSSLRGKTVDLSPYGVKVALPPGALRLTRGARLLTRVSLPDGGDPLALAASIVRVDRDGVALNFEGLREADFLRLKRLVDSLLSRLTGEPTPPQVSVRPVRERRKAPRAEVALDVSFDEEKPYDWRGKTVDLSPYGVKVALPASAIRPSEGTSVRLRLTTPDESPVSLRGMVWRREPKHTALIFVDLDRESLEQLRSLVNTLSALPA
jgi:hypothetical protein